jgi:apolipoprotein D and lipocalin family protein
MKTFQSIALFLLGALGVPAQCPPANFDAVDSLDVEGFIEERWYSMKQIVVPYQPENQFYCVSALYTENKRRFKSVKCLIEGCDDPRQISVFNSARRGSTGGPQNRITFTGTLIEPGKVFVGPGFLPRLIDVSSNYWVVAIGAFSDLGFPEEDTGKTYDWAVITSGSPSDTGDNGCYSGGGMWLFSRKTDVSEAALDAIEQRAVSLGLDTSLMKAVEHDGCEYPNPVRLGSPFN